MAREIDAIELRVNKNRVTNNSNLYVLIFQLQSINAGIHGTINLAVSMPKARVTQ